MPAPLTVAARRVPAPEPAVRRDREQIPGDPGHGSCLPGRSRRHTVAVRPQPLGTASAVTATAVCAGALALAAWVDARMADPPATVLGGVFAVVIAGFATLLVHARPGNAIGRLLLVSALLQAGSVGLGAYGGYGVDVAEPDWPLAAVAAQAGSMLWLPSFVLPVTVPWRSTPPAGCRRGGGGGRWPPWWPVSP